MLDPWYDVDDASSYAMLERELEGARPSFMAPGAQSEDAPHTRDFVRRRRDDGSPPMNTVSIPARGRRRHHSVPRRGGTDRRRRAGGAGARRRRGHRGRQRLDRPHRRARSGGRRPRGVAAGARLWPGLRLRGGCGGAGNRYRVLPRRRRQRRSRLHSGNRRAGRDGAGRLRHGIAAARTSGGGQPHHPAGRGGMAGGQAAPARPMACASPTCRRCGRSAPSASRRSA